MLPDRKTLLRALDPAFLISVGCTVAFYVMVHQDSMHGTLLHRYTTEHAVEYVIVALFMWGIVDVVMKALGFPKELFAMRHEWLPPRQGREPVANAEILLEEVLSKPEALQETRIGRRLAAALEHVADKGSAEEFRDQLAYLADLDEDAVHSGYTLTRFIIGVAPVLGFLGTVVHFGTALGGVSFEEMAEKLPLVVGEMGEAFNTTTVALTAALTMMLSLFVCERMEHRMLRSLNRLVDRELLNRFEIKDPSITPFLAAVQTANNDALLAINSSLDRQVDSWSGASASCTRSSTSGKCMKPLPGATRSTCCKRVTKGTTRSAKTA